MKRFIRLWVSLLLAGTLTHAQETEVPQVVRTQLEYVGMPKADLTRLLMEEKSVSIDATALRMKVQALVDKDGAEIIDTQLVLSKSNAKATSESVHEFIFPSEYEPPGLPCNFAPPDTSLPAVFRRYQAVPTAFETRNLGSSLEVQATASGASRVVDFTVSSSFTWHTGDRVWREWKTMNDNKLSIRMPDFYAVEVNATGVCASGRYSLLAVVSPKGPKGEVDPDRKLMVFVKCDVLELR